MRATASKIEDEKAAAGPLNQLRQADLYFDARPNPNVRAFLRARFLEQRGAASGVTNPSASVTGATGLQSTIDELWIKADWARTVFFTAGKQHVKWGSGHIWNPTDFTATQTRDPFDLVDRRLGQTMLKLHIPDEKRAFNYYAVVMVGDDASRNDAVGGALRGEFAFLGTGELALSLAARKAQPTRLGFDVSTALGPLDGFVEGAVSRRETRTFYEGTLDPKTGQLPKGYKDDKRSFAQVVAGLNNSWKYSDDDNVIVGAEYLTNDLGYDYRNLGDYALVTGQVAPLYVGRRYAGAYVTLTSPGSWNDTSFYLSGLRNLSDKTAQARLTATWTFHKEATLEVFASRCFGDYGELCFRVPESFRTLAQSPAVPLEQKAVFAALPNRRTTGSIGSAFSMQF